MEKILLRDRAIVKIVFGVAFVTALVDQVTKWIILTSLTPGSAVDVIPGCFDLTLVFNKGAAFGIFGSINSKMIRLSLLSLSTVVALTVLFLVLFREYKNDKFAQAVVGLILGGAIGNVIDRIRIGAVVDFLDVYIGTYHWPAFNVADSAICVGIVFLLSRRTKSTQIS